MGKFIDLCRKNSLSYIVSVIIQHHYCNTSYYYFKNLSFKSCLMFFLKQRIQWIYSSLAKKRKGNWKRRYYHLLQCTYKLFVVMEWCYSITYSLGHFNYCTCSLALQPLIQHVVCKACFIIVMLIQVFQGVVMILSVFFTFFFLCVF